MKNKSLIGVMVILVILIVFMIFNINNEKINNFQDCISAGYPTMESYPRQCSDGKNTWTEKVGNENYLFPNEILEIAQNSECTQKGTLIDNYFYNENSETWWIDLTLFEDLPNCNPACVINMETMRAEINYRCTGLIE